MISNPQPRARSKRAASVDEMEPKPYFKRNSGNAALIQGEPTMESALPPGTNHKSGTTRMTL